MKLAPPKLAWFIAAILIQQCRNLLVSQGMGFMDQPELHRNSLSISVSCQSYFDHAAAVPTKIRVYEFFKKPAFELAYSRQLDAKNGLSFSCRAYQGFFFGYWSNNPCTKEGQVMLRQYLMLAADYDRYLMKRKGVLLFGLAGLNFRYGHELIGSCIPKYFEPIYFPLRDLGLTVGMRGVLPLGKRLRLLGNVKFTEYVFRAVATNDPWYTNFARYGATKHMLSLQLGLGYGF